ncbi:gluconokinase [Pseudothermotoga sp.]|uniref:gluconokinase n=1 Tax=Pseudothermotoga sp. TaxID=2033661 RepID=UPI0031F71496
MGLYVGVDIGTTAVKVILYDSDAMKVLVDVSQQYDVFTTGASMFEQDPKQIEDAIFKALQIIGEKYPKIEGIVLDSMLHSLLFLDERFEPLGNVVPWVDERSIPQVFQIKKNRDLAQLLQKKAGCANNFAYPLFKLMWFAQNDKERLIKSSKIVSIKDYIFYKLTGTMVSDISVASGSGFLDIHTKKWLAELLRDLVGIDERKLPQLVPPSFEEPLSSEAAERTGFYKGTPVFIGISDAAASSIGSGAGVDDSLTISSSSSAAIRGIVSEPPKEYPSPGVWCYVVDEKYYISGVATSNGGIVFDWYVKLFSKYDHAHLIKMIEENLYDVNLHKAVLFYPFVFSERFPELDPNLSAKFLRLRGDISEAAVARSVLEGIIFNLRRIFDVVKFLPKKLERVYSTGGLTRADVWTKILATVINERIIVQSKRQGTALGAIWHLLGENHRKKAMEAIKEELEVYEPDEKLRAHYEELYKLWCENF